MERSWLNNINGNFTAVIYSFIVSFIFGFTRSNLSYFTKGF